MLDPLTNLSLTACLLALLAIAMLTDFRDRRIPNSIVMIGLVIGVLGHGWSAGFGGLAVGAIGACVGLLCFLPLYIAGGMGAGDVKLMAMCGAFLGAVHTIIAAAATLFVGSILGIAWTVWQFSTSEDESPEQGKVVSGIPYAFAIGLGTCLSLVTAPAIAVFLK
jgi:prepilin peptidase CpaA